MLHYDTRALNHCGPSVQRQRCSTWLGLSTIRVGLGNQVTREHGRPFIASRDRHLDTIADVMSDEHIYPLRSGSGSASGTGRNVLNTPWWYLRYGTFASFQPEI